MVDYCTTDISSNPVCSHGPSVLFCKKGSGKRFYACSAFRSRKKCPFFLWEDDYGKKKQTAKDLQNRFEYCHVQKIVELSIKDRNWCHSCEILFSSREKLNHQEHEIEIAMSDDIISQPSMLFVPKEESKGESQFYFSDTTVITIVKFLRDLEVSGVLCVGCPRIHEYILRNNIMKSMLLDIDSRYVQFYTPSQFQPFNMFNGHAFDINGWINIERFMDTKKLAIIADPPFGGRTEPLAYTFKRLKALKKDDNVIEFVILPYFMEPFVLASFPGFSMLDYKAVYVNHRKFRKHDVFTGSSKSAVRIFTNVNPSEFKLSGEDYRYCSICNRWVCKENQHCDICNTCTSKNGAAYKHCNLCKKCVKCTWQHCDQCGICKLIGHRCTAKIQTKIEVIDQSNHMKRKNIKQKKKFKKRKRNHSEGDV